MIWSSIEADCPPSSDGRVIRPPLYPREILSGRCWVSISPLSVMTAALSTVFCNSRILPGQAYPINSCRAAEFTPNFVVLGESIKNRSTISGMSSFLSLRAGRNMVNTFSRKYRSSRNRPSFTITSRFLLVAAIKRTSTLIGLVPPTRSNSLSCRTLNILACKFRGISPISSRKMVPRLATSNFPDLRDTAPVKAPFSCPKSSLSSSSSGIAAQLIFTKGRCARLLCSNILVAISSLPVPLSPRISTVASVGATFMICFKTPRMATLSPTILGNSWRASTLFNTSVIRLKTFA